MSTLGMTHSVCRQCRQIVPAKILADGGKVYFEKFCPACGPDRRLVYGDLEQYLRTQRFVKPALVPREHAGRADKPCPLGCGMCSRHEQHLCMPIVEVTSRCDLDCPVCIAGERGQWDMSRRELATLLDGLIRAEGQVDILTLSGGEPLRHPRITGILDDLHQRREIVRTSVSTNGLALLEEPALLEAMVARDAVVSLQFDGFDEAAYLALRGRGLLDRKLGILDLLERSGAAVSLTMTLARGVNDRQLGPVLEYYFAHPHVVSLMLQPVALAGRAADLPQAWRLSIPEVVAALDATGQVSAADFAPLPCSHPLCFCLAYYLGLDGGGFVSINRLVGADALMDTLANRAVFGLSADEHERLKDLVYDLWSGPAGTAPDAPAVLDTLRSILGELSGACFDPRKAFAVAQRRVKSVFIHAFQDADTLDLARLRRCCHAYPRTDGRLVPACALNVLGGRP